MHYELLGSQIWYYLAEQGKRLRCRIAVLGIFTPWLNKSKRPSNALESAPLGSFSYILQRIALLECLHIQEFLMPLLPLLTFTRGCWRSSTVPASRVVHFRVQRRIRSRMLLLAMNLVVWMRCGYARDNEIDRKSVV